MGAADAAQILAQGAEELHYSMPRASDDGGRIWASYAVPWGGREVEGTAVALPEARPTYRASRGPPATTADVVVAHSSDGGRRWSEPVRVAKGTGTEIEGIANDHHGLAASSDGNAVVGCSLSWV